MSVDLFLLAELGIAVALGALIGAEREVTETGRKNRKNGIEFSGLRTYSIISLLGFLAAFFGQFFGQTVFSVFAAVVAIFLMVEYWLHNRNSVSSGITSELAAFTTFAVGALVNISLLAAISVAVVITIILALKKWLRSFLQRVSEIEFFATLKFILIAFVVLPILPSEPIDPWGFIDLHNIWLMVVFISAISFVGYFLTKMIGAKKGLGLTGLVGGLASSTAVTTAMSEQSRGNPRLQNTFTLAVVIASAVMFGRVVFEVFILNRELLPQIATTLGVMFATSGGVLIYLWRQSSRKEQKQKTEKELKVGSPFRIAPALKFGLFYVLILVVANLANRFFGENGIYFAATISGLADVDAITISLSHLAKSGELAGEVATRAITLAVLVNTLIKLSIIRFFGSKKFFQQAVVAFSVILASGLGAIFLI